MMTMKSCLLNPATILYGCRMMMLTVSGEMMAAVFRAVFSYGGAHRGQRSKCTIK